MTSLDRPELRRPLGRGANELREVSIELGAMKFAEGSALVTMGDTEVLVAASVENRVPPFLLGEGRGWVTAEYSMLPRATPTRSQREVSRGRPSGRTAEIQRLIGRSLRAVVDLAALGERTIIIDCDVLQADGGTRTAAITGAWIALVQAAAGILLTGDIRRWPIRRQLAAVSVGLVEGRPLLDLEYVEDRDADVDMNVVATVDGGLVEIQGTGEEHVFEREDLDRMIDLALEGIEELGATQRRVLADVQREVDDALAGGRAKASPKDEGELWGEPGQKE